MEWSVLDWNQRRSTFYDRSARAGMREWQICRLTARDWQQYA